MYFDWIPGKHPKSVFYICVERVEGRTEHAYMRKKTTLFLNMCIYYQHFVLRKKLWNSRFHLKCRLPVLWGDILKETPHAGRLVSDHAETWKALRYSVPGENKSGMERWWFRIPGCSLRRPRLCTSSIRSSLLEIEPSRSLIFKSRFTDLSTTAYQFLSRDFLFINTQNDFAVVIFLQ